MTHEEAKKILKDYHDVVIGDDGSNIDVAMRMAIESLELASRLDDEDVTFRFSIDDIDFVDEEAKKEFIDCLEKQDTSDKLRNFEDTSKYRYFCMEDMCDAENMCDACEKGYERGYANGYAKRRIEEMEEHKKYSWHDLRKNPNDLPPKYEDVIVVNDDGIQHIGLLRYGNWGNKKNPCMIPEWCIKYCCYDTDVWEEQENGKIIAWREIEPIEPFEVEE